MKKLNLNWKYLLVAALAVCAFASLAGYPIIPPDAITGIGMAPLLVGQMEFAEVKALIEKQGSALEVFKKSVFDRLENVETHLKTGARPPASGGGSGSQSSETKDAFLAYMRTGRESELQKKSMSISADPDGGYLVPEEMDKELSKNLRNISPMRQLARVVPVGSASFKQPHSKGGTGYTWVGEQQSRPETAKPDLKLIEVPTNEIYAMPGVTQSLLDDNAFNLENWLIEEVSDAFGDGEGDAFINGSGVNKPRGLFTYDVVSTADATRPHGKFQYIPTGASGAFHTNQADPLISLIYAVKPQYRQNAAWLISPEVLEAVRKFKSTTNEYIWQPSLGAGQPSTLLGYPVYEDANIPAISAGSLSVAFGQISRAYTITDRNTTMLRDPFTNKPYVMFYVSRRVGGGAGRDTNAVKFLKFSAS